MLSFYWLCKPNNKYIVIDLMQTTCSEILLLEEVNISLYFLFPAATPPWFGPFHQGKKAFYSQKDKSELTYSTPFEI